MRASVFLLIPMALGWGLMLLVLGPVVLVVRHAGAGALLVRARWAAALACQRLEAHLYARVGGPEAWTARALWHALGGGALVAGLNALGAAAYPAARDALDAAIVGVKLVLAAVLLAFGTALLADLVALGRFRVLAAARAHALPLPRRWGGCVVKLLA